MSCKCHFCTGRWRKEDLRAEKFRALVAALAKQWKFDKNLRSVLDKTICLELLATPNLQVLWHHSEEVVLTEISWICCFQRQITWKQFYLEAAIAQLPISYNKRRK